MMRDDSEDLLANVIPVDAVKIQSIEDGGRRRHTGLLVVDRCNPAINECGGRRFPEIVTHGTNHHDNLPGAIEILNSGSRLIADEQRMNPDITFRVPLGLLFAPDERVNLREETFDDPEVERQLQADRRTKRLE